MTARSALSTAALAISMAASSDALADEADVCASAAEEGQALRDQSKYLEARDTFRRCARESCPGVVRKDCGEWLASLEEKTPTIVLAAKDAKGNDLADVKVTIGDRTIATALDGKALPINPGKTRFHFEADAGSQDVEVVILEGQRARVVSAEIGKPAGSAGDKPTGSDTTERRTPTAFVVVPWVMVGLGAATLGAFGVLQGIARGELADVEEGCGKTRTCTADQLDPIQTKFTASAVMFGVSIAALTTSAALWIFAPSEPVKKAASALTIDAGPGGGVVGLRFPL